MDLGLIANPKRSFLFLSESTIDAAVANKINFNQIDSVTIIYESR